METVYILTGSALLSLFIAGSYEGVHFFCTRKKLKRLRNTPFPKEYLSVIDKLLIYRLLTPQEQKEMHYLMLRFIDEKNISGVQGFVISDEVRAVIAFYACLLLLHIRRHDLYGNLDNIVVYPYEFILNEVKSYGGVYTKQRYILEGQSANDTVIVSWHSAQKDAFHLHDSNVLIHEFAHELDFLDGEIDGVPPMDAVRFASWSKNLFGTYKRLSQKNIKGRFFGKYRLFGSYAATNEAEFFAVATERFYLAPAALKKKFPSVYEELKEFYHIDMAQKTL